MRFCAENDGKGISEFFSLVPLKLGLPTLLCDLWFNLGSPGNRNVLYHSFLVDTDLISRTGPSALFALAFYGN